VFNNKYNKFRTCFIFSVVGATCPYLCRDAYKSYILEQITSAHRYRH